jgi:hypothetical protein
VILDSPDELLDLERIRERGKERLSTYALPSNLPSRASRCLDT